jgi:uncharacterized protein YndB with AHSA1/START domain
MQPPEGEAFHLSGEFLEIQAPSALRFTFRWDEPVPDDRETVVELSLDSPGERTKVTVDPRGCSPGKDPALQESNQVIALYNEVFPDLTLTFQDIVTAGDKIAVRWTASGTHEGDHSVCRGRTGR